MSEADVSFLGRSVRPSSHRPPDTYRCSSGAQRVCTFQGELNAQKTFRVGRKCVCQVPEDWVDEGIRPIQVCAGSVFAKLMFLCCFQYCWPWLFVVEETLGRSSRSDAACNTSTVLYRALHFLLLSSLKVFAAARHSALSKS